MIAVVFWLYQFFWFSSGFALLLLMKVKTHNFVSTYAWSCCIGIAISIIQYFLFMSLKCNEINRVVSLAVFLLSLYLISKKNIEEQNLSYDTQGWIIVLLFILALIIINFFSVSLVNTIPNETGGTGYYVDWLFWTGNNISFTKGIPVQDFRFYGNPFRYHYLSSVIVAQFCLITGIDCVVFSFYLSYIIPTVLLVLASYSMISTIIKDKWFIATGILFILFTGGSTITYEWHIYVCPFGYDYGMIFGMLSICALLRLLAEPKNIQYYVLSAIGLFLCTGSKGPIGLVVLFGFFAASLYLLCKKNTGRAIIYGLGWLCCFVLPFFLFIYSFNGSSAYGSQGLGFLGFNLQNWYTQSIYNYVNNLYGDIAPQIMIKIYSLWLYIYGSNKVAIALLFIGLITFITNIVRKKVDKNKLVLIFISLAGVLLSCTTVQSGGAEMYFIMSSIPYSVLLGLYSIEGKENSSATIIPATKTVCIIIILLIGGISCNTFYNTMIGKMREGLFCINDNYTKEYYDTSWEHYVSSSDYDAYSWIKDNTSNDSLIAIDVFVDKDGYSDVMVGGVFSERFVWNECTYTDSPEANRRHDLVNSIISGNSDSLSALKEEGVDYFVQSRRLADNYTLGESEATCVFENESFKIFKLR